MTDRAGAAAALVATARAGGSDIVAVAHMLASLHPAGRDRRHTHGIRLAHHDAAQLPPSDVADIVMAPVPGHAGLPLCTLSATFLGLTGAVSPLPQATAAALAEAGDEPGGAALATWLAELHHRLLQLWLTGMATARPARAARQDLGDVWSRRLIGWAEPAAGALPGFARLAHWAALAKPHASGRDLCHALAATLAAASTGPEEDLRTAVALTPLTGAAVPVPGHRRWALGQSSGRLGEDALLGSHAVLPAAGLTITLGPVSSSWLDACAPVAPRLAHALSAVVSAMLPPGVRARVQVARLAHDGAGWRLGAGAKPAPGGLMGLGLTTTLGVPTRAWCMPWAWAPPIQPDGVFT